jgi:hypothetical protein
MRLRCLLVEYDVYNQRATNNNAHYYLAALCYLPWEADLYLHGAGRDTIKESMVLTRAKLGVYLPYKILSSPACPRPTGVISKCVYLPYGKTLL